MQRPRGSPKTVLSLISICNFPHIFVTNLKKNHPPRANKLGHFLTNVWNLTRSPKLWAFPKKSVTSSSHTWAAANIFHPLMAAADALKKKIRPLNISTCRHFRPQFSAMRKFRRLIYDPIRSGPVRLGLPMKQMEIVSCVSVSVFWQMALKSTLSIHSWFIHEWLHLSLSKKSDFADFLTSHFLLLLTFVRCKNLFSRVTFFAHVCRPVKSEQRHIIHRVISGQDIHFCNGGNGA